MHIIRYIILAFSLVTVHHNRLKKVQQKELEAAPPPIPFVPAPKGDCIYHDHFKHSCDASWEII